MGHPSAMNRHQKMQERQGFQGRFIAEKIDDDYPVEAFESAPIKGIVKEFS
jgi:hypothetical protein